MSALLLTATLALASDFPCGTIARTATAADLEVAIGFQPTTEPIEAPRTPQQRHASERLLLDMGDCPEDFAVAVADSFQQGSLDKFVLVMRDDLERTVESKQGAPGLQDAIARVLSAPAPPRNNVFQVFTNALAHIPLGGATAKGWNSCGPLVVHTVNILAEEYRDRGGEFGGNLMAHVLHRLNTCPEAVLSAMRRNPNLLSELISGGHDSPFWGDIGGLSEMRDIKRQLVLRMRQHRPSTENAGVYQKLRKGLEDVCISVLGYQELPPPCPIDDRRQYTPDRRP